MVRHSIRPTRGLFRVVYGTDQLAAAYRTVAAATESCAHAAERVRPIDKVQTRERECNRPVATFGTRSRGPPVSYLRSHESLSLGIALAMTLTCTTKENNDHAIHSRPDAVRR